MKRESESKKNIYYIYTDGASRGNPGPAAYGFVFLKEDVLIHQKSSFIGKATNNTAEYLAIINALKDAIKYTNGHIKVFSDSQLVVCQINGLYRVNNSHLLVLRHEIHELCEKFKKAEFFHVGRNNLYIQKCDLLCNNCLNSQSLM